MQQWRVLLTRTIDEGSSAEYCCCLLLNSTLTAGHPSGLGTTLNGQCFMSFLVVDPLTNQTLEGKDGVLQVHNCLLFSRQINKTLAMLGECNAEGVIDEDH